MEFEENLAKNPVVEGAPPAWEWSDVGIPTHLLKKFIETGTVRRLSRRWYVLANREEVKKALGEFDQVQKIAEEGMRKPLPHPAEVPQDLFDVVEGYDDLKEFLRLSLRAERPVHVLLVGPPGTAKSLFLMELERLGGVFCTAGSSTKAGIRDLIFEYLPRYLIIDELEKIADQKDLAVLLAWMESGRVVVTKHGQHEKREGRGWVFGACNTTRGLPPELLDRFQVFHLKPYSPEEFRKIVTNYLDKRVGVPRELAQYIAEQVGKYTVSVREAVRIASLAKTKEDVDKVLAVVKKYKKEA